MNDTAITIPQRRILNLLAIKGVTLIRMGYDRHYLCHPTGPRTFVHMSIATALIQAGYVAVDGTDGEHTTYVLSDVGRQALGGTE